MYATKNPEFNKKPEVISDIKDSTGNGPNAITARMNSREGETNYYNNWFHLLHIEYWDNQEADTGTTGETVSDYMTQIWQKLKFENGSQFLETGSPFNGYRIETWNLNRAVRTPDKIDGGIERHAGLTWPNKLTKINSAYCKSGGVYSHEFGHNYHFTCGISDPPKGRVGYFLDAEYERLRGEDFTIRTPKYERFAEDFKYFFGTDDVANKDNPEDDAAHPTLPEIGRQVRWAREVMGLKRFIRGAWPVYHLLNDYMVSNFTYVDYEAWFRWQRKKADTSYLWESFADGVFFWWDGQHWIQYN